MTNNAVLIFTFSPIQELISEARRANDLFAGSRTLVILAQSVGKVLQTQGELVFPATLSEDVPNRLVAKVPWEEAKAIAAAATDAFHKEWQGLADVAKKELASLKPAQDAEWEGIWRRQTGPGYLWEIYWAAASMQGRSYKDAYEEADRTLAASKRQRQFEQHPESGIKDTLSGKRQALRTKDLDAASYWAAVSEKNRSVTQSRLRPDGKEKLDAIGSIKRFGDLAKRQIEDYLGFPSVSSVACEDYLERVGDKPELVAYNDALSNLNVFHVRKKDRSPWHYDGAFFYPETLRTKRLEQDYGLKNPDAEKLKVAIQALATLRKKHGSPSTYYAIIRFDGDDMGKRITESLASIDPETEHKSFSETIAKFSDQVQKIASKHKGFLIYNGGDDVLALAPLSSCFNLAKELASEFKQIVKQSASAGIAITHHKYPLGAALRLSAEAEQIAKHSTLSGHQKDAVAIVVLKRSGAPDKVVAHWDDIQTVFEEVTLLLKNETISSGFIYNLANSVQTLYDADDLFEVELVRVLGRSRGKENLEKSNVKPLASKLFSLAQKLPTAGPSNGQARELSKWLLMADFISGGGSD